MSTHRDPRHAMENDIGAEIVEKSAPDGHTLLMPAASFITNAAVFRPMPYDPDWSDGCGSPMRRR